MTTHAYGITYFSILTDVAKITSYSRTLQTYMYIVHVHCLCSIVVVIIAAILHYDNIIIIIQRTIIIHIPVKGSNVISIFREELQVFDKGKECRIIKSYLQQVLYRYMCLSYWYCNVCKIVFLSVMTTNVFVWITVLLCYYYTIDKISIPCFTFFIQ